MRGDRPNQEHSIHGEIGFTPHARGSTLLYQWLRKSLLVYPACAGIDLTSLTRRCRRRGLPRMRGDRPQIIPSYLLLYPFTPHARGSTYDNSREFPFPEVYPACAGIDLPCLGLLEPLLRLPRMRGDRPPWKSLRPAAASFTPHARGSTPLRLEQLAPLLVYPACAGIDPGIGHILAPVEGLPRMRGDRPPLSNAHLFPLQFTPHARGSTLATGFQILPELVYPACAGIDLSFFLLLI